MCRRSWGDLKAVDVTLPQKAYSFVLTLTRGDSRLYDLMVPARGALAPGLRPNQRATATITMGFPGAGGAATCAESSRTFVMGEQGGSNLTACLRLPEGATTGAWREFTSGGLPIEYDTWQPLLAYLPHVLSPADGGLEPTAGGSGTAAARTVAPASWLVLSLCTSRGPLEELGDPPPPPTIAELVKAHPGEFPSLQN